MRFQRVMGDLRGSVDQDVPKPEMMLNVNTSESEPSSWIRYDDGAVRSRLASSLVIDKKLQLPLSILIEA